MRLLGRVLCVDRVFWERKNSSSAYRVKYVALDLQSIVFSDLLVEAQICYFEALCYANRSLFHSHCVYFYIDIDLNLEKCPAKKNEIYKYWTLTGFTAIIM